MRKRLKIEISAAADATLERAAQERGVEVGELLRRALNTYLYLAERAFDDGTVLVVRPDGSRCHVLVA